MSIPIPAAIIRTPATITPIMVPLFLKNGFGSIFPVGNTVMTTVPVNVGIVVNWPSGRVDVVNSVVRVVRVSSSVIVPAAGVSVFTTSTTLGDVAEIGNGVVDITAKSVEFVTKVDAIGKVSVSKLVEVTDEVTSTVVVDGVSEVFTDVSEEIADMDSYDVNVVNCASEEVEETEYKLVVTRPVAEGGGEVGESKETDASVEDSSVDDTSLELDDDEVEEVIVVVESKGKVLVKGIVESGGDVVGNVSETVEFTGEVEVIP
jgi:hypothetical protein